MATSRRSVSQARDDMWRSKRLVATPEYVPQPAIVEVRVTDGGSPQLPRPRTASAEEPDGRGLTIVEALADRWGVDRDGLGQSVWAELS